MNETAGAILEALALVLVAIAMGVIFSDILARGPWTAEIKYRRWFKKQSRHNIRLSMEHAALVAERVMRKNTSAYIYLSAPDGAGLCYLMDCKFYHKALLPPRFGRYLHETPACYAANKGIGLVHHYES